MERAELSLSDFENDHRRMVQKANEEMQTATYIDDPYRLQYHLHPPMNWMNDPNGLIQWNGEYHVFFQHNPFGSNWGSMHWGHFRSKDLINWVLAPIALAPSASYDKDGCYSGCAIDDHGTLTLFYTGHSLVDNIQTEVQCVARSTDGIVFEKSPHNPILSCPESEYSIDFRDPKVWFALGQWYMVVGSGKGGKGRALLFKSDDLSNWSFISVCAESDGTLGHIWECPDLFQLEDKHVLVVSPMGLERPTNIYFVGHMNYESGQFQMGSMGYLDRGFDFYAGQTFRDENGRRILLGWMHSPGAPIPTQQYGWAGAMTVPRELSLRNDNSLCIRPIDELQSLRSRCLHSGPTDALCCDDHLELDFDATTIEIISMINLEETSAKEFGIRVGCSAEGSTYTEISYQSETRTVIVDRSKSGFRVNGISKVVLAHQTVLKLHIFVDRSSVEVLVNDREVITNRIYPDGSHSGITLFAIDGCLKLNSLDIWHLKSSLPETMMEEFRDV